MDKKLFAILGATTIQKVVVARSVRTKYERNFPRKTLSVGCSVVSIITFLSYSRTCDMLNLTTTVRNPYVLVYTLLNYALSNWCYFHHTSYNWQFIKWYHCHSDRELSPSRFVIRVEGIHLIGLIWLSVAHLCQTSFYNYNYLDPIVIC